VRLGRGQVRRPWERINRPNGTWVRAKMSQMMCETSATFIDLRRDRVKRGVHEGVRRGSVRWGSVFAGVDLIAS